MGALEHALPNAPPDTVAGWRAAADALLSPPCCTFHRNMEISSRYAWLYAQQPTCFKWAGMAAIASHHARLVLFPFRLDADRNGYEDLPRSLSRRRLLTEDANRMREVNNAIYDDIFWVHLAYLAAADGVEDLRRLLRPHREYAGLLFVFETIDRGRAVLADEGSPEGARREAADMVWAGNLALLEREQRAVVQPLFDRLSGTFARLVSMGSTTTFEVVLVGHDSQGPAPAGEIAGDGGAGDGVLLLAGLKATQRVCRRRFPASPRAGTGAGASAHRSSMVSPGR